MNGIICDNSVVLRRIAFHGASPSSRFNNMGFKILRFDDDQVKPFEEKTEEGVTHYKKYIDDAENYGTITWKSKEDPSAGWATPFVTGHKYKIHWGKTGLDWDRMTIDVSERWRESDKNIHLFHNFTDVRAKYDMWVDGVKKEEHNDTIPFDDMSKAISG